MDRQKDFLMSRITLRPACTYDLGRAGMRLAICDRDKRWLAETVETLAAEGVDVMARVLDVRLPQQLSQCFTEIDEALGDRLDVQGNVVGGTRRTDGWPRLAKANFNASIHSLSRGARERRWPTVPEGGQTFRRVGAAETEELHTQRSLEGWTHQPVPVIEGPLRPPDGALRSPGECPCDLSRSLKDRVVVDAQRHKPDSLSLLARQCFAGQKVVLRLRHAAQKRPTKGRMIPSNNTKLGVTLDDARRSPGYRDIGEKRGHKASAHHRTFQCRNDWLRTVDHVVHKITRLTHRSDAIGVVSSELLQLFESSGHPRPRPFPSDQNHPTLWIPIHRQPHLGEVMMHIEFRRIRVRSSEDDLEYPVHFSLELQTRKSRLQVIHGLHSSNESNTFQGPSRLLSGFSTPYTLRLVAGDFTPT